ncbi:MAG: ATP synthase subunit I [Desulfamplus sp.]|nr:ATP synthase subunit I [Desulfamplus sp.]
MDIQKRLILFVARSNWYILILATLLGLINTPLRFAAGIFYGGLLVTVNFHLLRKSISRAFNSDKKHSSLNSGIIGGALINYYMRFAISGIIIFALIFKNVVEPIGLLLGLSVVVASIMAAIAVELTRLIFKEAV